MMLQHFDSHLPHRGAVTLALPAMLMLPPTLALPLILMSTMMLIADDDDNDDVTSDVSYQ